MFVQDGLTVDRTWETPDRFLGFSARFARTGIQHYSGDQIDPEGQHLDDAGQRRFEPSKLYPVQRDASEVFAPRAMASFIAKPITNDHPSKGVNPNNWSDLAKGGIGEVLRDGEFARMGGLITDASAIAAYRSGKRELSGGYQTNLIIGDGVNDKGEAFVARQTAIDGNHVALVDKGRAGPECAIRDSVALCDANPAFLAAIQPKEPAMKIKIGDAEVDATNGEAVRIAVDALNVKLTATDKRATDAEAKVVEHAATITARDTKIAELETSLADAVITPAKLRDAAKEFSDVQAKAKALDVKFAEDADAAAIKKAVVTAKMGDAAKDYSDDHVAIAFDALTKDVKAVDKTVININPALNVGDAASKEAAALDSANDHNAWRKQA